MDFLLRFAGMIDQPIWIASAGVTVISGTRNPSFMGRCTTIPLRIRDLVCGERKRSRRKDRICRASIDGFRIGGMGRRVQAVA